MKLKAILFGLSVLIGSANAGFFDHDKAYYASHLDDADEKIKDCKKAMAIARIDKDKEKVMELMKDEECKAAFDAVKDHKRKIWEEERKARKKKEAEEKAKKKVLYDAEYKKQLAIFKEADYDKFMSLGKQDCEYYYGSSFGSNLSLKDAKCKAWKELQKDKVATAIDKLFSQHQGDELITYRKEVCQKEGYQSANCKLATDAAAKDEKDTIQRLSADKAALKKVFNECSNGVKALRKKMKWTDANALTSSFKCRTAMAAARKFGIFGLSQPMK